MRFAVCGRSSARILRRALRGQSGWPAKVMRGATEGEQPVDFMQTAQLYLAQRVGLLQPAEALLDRPASAQADGVARMPGRSAVEVRAALVTICRSLRTEKKTCNSNAGSTYSGAIEGRP